MEYQPVATDYDDYDPDNGKPPRISITIPILTDSEPASIVTHIFLFNDKMQQNAASAAIHFKLFPRSLSTILRMTWNSCCEEFEDDDALHMTDECFEEVSKSFVDEYASEHTRDDALRQLRNARKPRGLSVPNFLNRLKLLNKMTAYLPGDTATLPDEEIKTVFYNAMPAS